MKRLLLAVTLLAGSITASAALPFIEDDYAKGMATAKAKNVPLFVETWAPW